jgi:hypothetical protein
MPVVTLGGESGVSVESLCSAPTFPAGRGWFVYTQGGAVREPERLPPTPSLSPEEFEDFTETLLHRQRFLAAPPRRLVEVSRYGRRGDTQRGTLPTAFTRATCSAGTHGRTGSGGVRARAGAGNPALVSGHVVTGAGHRRPPDPLGAGTAQAGTRHRRATRDRTGRGSLLPMSASRA